jgi:hypothetical protein
MMGAVNFFFEDGYEDGRLWVLELTWVRTEGVFSDALRSFALCTG